MALNQDAFDSARDAYMNVFDGTYGSADKALEAAIEAYVASPLPRWRHVKGVTEYVEVGRGFAQASSHPITEMMKIVIYRSLGDGSLWVRSAAEFDDGRFVALAPTSPRAPAAAEMTSTAEAEAEAERRYPPHLTVIESPVECFLAGAAWQRDQSALSGGERAEVLQTLGLILDGSPATVEWHLDEGTKEGVAFLCVENPDYVFDNGEDPRLVINLGDLAARLRSAPSEGEPRHLTREEERILDRALHAGATNARPIEAAPSPAPEQRVDTALPEPYGYLHIDVATGITYAAKPSPKTTAVFSEQQVRTLLSAFPHPVPAADTIAVPRETLSRVEQWFRVGSSPEERDFSIEITRLLGEMP